MSKKFPTPVERPGDGWARKIARQATETGALLIDYDFARQRYFVTDTGLNGAEVIASSKNLQKLLNRYGFTDEHLLES